MSIKPLKIPLFYLPDYENIGPYFHSPVNQIQKNLHTLIIRHQASRRRGVQIFFLKQFQRAPFGQRSVRHFFAIEEFLLGRRTGIPAERFYPPIGHLDIETFYG